MASKHDTHKLIAGQYIANLGITAAKIATSAVTTTKLADLAVTTGKINTGAISSAKIGAVAVRTAAIGTSQVTTTKLADRNVTSAKIATSGVTLARLTSALRRGHIIRHITETAASRELFGGNSTTGMNFFAALRVRSAQLIWNGSTSGSCLRVNIFKNASTVCVLGTTVTPGKKWLNHASTSAQMSAATFATTDRFRAQTRAWATVKTSVGVPVLVIEYQLV